MDSIKLLISVMVWFGIWLIIFAGETGQDLFIWLHYGLVRYGMTFNIKLILWFLRHHQS